MKKWVQMVLVFLVMFFLTTTGSFYYLWRQERSRAEEFKRLYIAERDRPDKNVFDKLGDAKRSAEKKVGKIASTYYWVKGMIWKKE